MTETTSADRRARLVEAARPHLDRLAGREPHIGPPPPMPLMCFRCATNTCACSDAVKRSDVHGGGLVPALTMHHGTALCLDCASADADAEGGRP